MALQRTTKNIQMKKKPKKNFADIQLLIMDVDGVLTDGTVMINGDGSEGKSFNLLDGHGIKMWKRAGLKAAFLSGRFSQATDRRAKELDIDYCLQPPCLPVARPLRVFCRRQNRG